MSNPTKNKLISAIDLGSSKIVTVMAQMTSDALSGTESMNIVGVSSVVSRGIKKGHIIDIEEAVEAITSSVEAAERMAGYSIESAYVSLGGDYISSQNSHGVVAVSDSKGEISFEDVTRVIEAASAVSLPSSREIIHVLPREYIVDGEAGIRDPVGMSGVRLEVETHLVTASAVTVKNLRKAINELGINVNEFVFTGLAASEAVLTETEKELGCILIDLGDNTVSVAVFIESSLYYSTVIPIGARYVTKDLALGLKVQFEAAEKIKLALSEQNQNFKNKFLKTMSEETDTNNEDKKNKKTQNQDEFQFKEFGVEENKKVSKKTLVEGIIRPRLDEIFNLVKMQIEKDDLISRIPAGVILTGGGSKTVGVVDSAKKIFHLPVRLGQPSGFGGLVDDILDPSYAVSLGLILYAAKYGNYQSSVKAPFLVNKFKFIKFGFFDQIVRFIKEFFP
ncbi:MAG: cell division protein FtsA [Patescibacteria group bacterium]|nr:cell division protein FtsA [Patescibacteria group bacterium]